MYTPDNDRYYLLELIASNPSHTCYRALNRSTHELVFLKLSNTMCHDVDHHTPVCKRIHAEAAMLQLLARHSANVPRVIEVGHHDNHVTLVLEFVSGSTLDEYAAENDLDPQTTAAILDEIGATLELAHDLGFVHHKIKPTNIIVPTTGEAVLVAWGSATWIRRPEERMRYGNFDPGYASLDQLMGRVLVTNDFYAMGQTLQRVCRPLNGRAMELIRRAKARPPHSYATVAAMRRDLKRLADNRGLTFFYR